MLEVLDIHRATWNPLSQGGDLPDWKMPRLIFIEGDVFNPELDYWIADEVFATVRLQKLHTFMMTTRHVQRMRTYLQNASNLARISNTEYSPPPNLWAGVAVNNQAEFDEALSVLSDCRTKVRYLHIMPTCIELDASRLSSRKYDGVDWIYIPAGCDEFSSISVEIPAVFGCIPIYNHLALLNWPRGWKAPQWTREDAIAAGEEWEEIDWDDAAF